VSAPSIEVSYSSVLVAWGLLLAVACAALVGLVLLGRSADRAGPRPPRPTAQECARLHGEAEELRRDATATAHRAAAAHRAGIEARARQAAAQHACGAALQAFDAAQRAYAEADAELRARRAEHAARVRDEAERRQEQTVSQAALAAYRRGDLSVEQLREVFRRTGGWDPVLEQREREVAGLRAQAYRARRAYDAAVAAERAAAAEVHVAAVAVQALAEEAGHATADAHAAGQAAAGCDAALRRRLRLAWPRGARPAARGTTRMPPR
jgi:hypothetical protein